MIKESVNSSKSRMKESRYIELQATKHILLHDLSHILCNLLLKFENENSQKGLYILQE